MGRNAYRTGLAREQQPPANAPQPPIHRLRVVSDDDLPWQLREQTPGDDNASAASERGADAQAETAAHPATENDAEIDAELEAAIDADLAFDAEAAYLDCQEDESWLAMIDDEDELEPDYFQLFGPAPDDEDDD